MDSDVGEEVTFSAIFPLPFRVLVLAGLGILSWATNLHGLSIAGIDAPYVLNLDNRHSHHHPNRRTDSPLPTEQRSGWKMVSNPRSLHAPVYRLSIQCALITSAAWLVYRNATAGTLGLVDVFKYIPAVTGLLMFMVLVSPFNVFGKPERDAFLHAIHRCMFAPSEQPVHFSDVVLADVFTSYAKVIGDVWLSLCMLLPGGSLLVQPQFAGWSRWILPALMSLPYAVRFRQCIIEYRLSGNRTQRHMYNAIKYASAFPVIFLSAAQRLVGTDAIPAATVKVSWLKAHPIFRIWLLAAAVNSLYSFWWDVTHDWGFDLLSTRSEFNPVAKNHLRSPPKRLLLPKKHSLSDEDVEDISDPHDILDSAPSHNPRRYPYGLRPTLLFPLPVYPFAILVDLVLRLTWSVKLSSHLHSKTEGDLLIFWIEMAELVRRWMWLFLRVEWEVVKEREGNRSRRPSHDDSILSRYSSPATNGVMGSAVQEEYELTLGTGSQLPRT
ncbi:EXS-domain-containing protein [Cristinia sonorae]|uniref:EXS-domain-containing protein n=1 Tax=Cristinia sonorae TaxID=1940300 RepID=A0A8K0V0U0_9AGAR|nr:EXS-domain-containing protein [Cristinia sonorae]